MPADLLPRFRKIALKLSPGETQLLIKNFCLDQELEVDEMREAGSKATRHIRDAIVYFFFADVGWQQASLAREFGCDRSSINHIIVRYANKVLGLRICCPSDIFTDDEPLVDWTKFGYAVAAWRADMTQQQAAKLAGVKRSILNSVSNGRAIQTGQFLALCYAAGLDPMAFYPPAVSREHRVKQSGEVAA